MAGIGFELKKLFRREGMLGTVIGGAYATMVTVGPTILVIVALNVMYYILPYANVVYREKEVLSAVILYVFIFSLLISGPVNIFLSRYIADKVFEERYDVLSSAIEFGNQIIAVLVAVIGIPFAFFMYYKGHLTIPFIAMSYVFFIGLAFTFYYMTFITLLKEYRMITYSFIAGLLIGMGASLLMNYIVGFSAQNSILFGMMIGFNVIAVFLFVMIRKTFPMHIGNSRELRKFAWQQRYLIGSNLFYLLGLYIHNFVFWGLSEYRVVVSDVFVCAPIYDEATFLAMLTNLSFLVVFVVNVETKFHSAYQIYCQSVIGAGGHDIAKSKSRMLSVLRNELLSIIQLQFIIIIILFLIANILIPKLGMDGAILNIYPVMAVGFFLINLVQGLMIFLFYLDDAKGACITGLIFFLGILLGSLVTVHFSTVYCGLGVVFGGFCGFTFIFFRIRYMFLHLDEHIFCRDNIVKKIKTPKSNQNVTIFTNESAGMEESR